MTRVPIWCHADGFAAAVGQLAGVVTTAPGPAGAVSVIPGRVGWPDAARQAVEQGAIAVVLACPVPAPLHSLDAVGALGVPVVTDRPNLRPDLATFAQTAIRPHMITAEVYANGRDLIAASQDALGWVRLLTGEAVLVETVVDTAAASIAAASTAGGIPVSVTLVRGAEEARPVIEVAALGSERVEVRVDRSTAECWIRVADVNGVSQSPTRWETSERLALRRVLAALEGEASTDVEGLRIDTLAASAFGQGISDVDSRHRRFLLP